jgi:hypothetical protein
MKRIAAVESPQSKPRLSQDPGLKIQPPGTEFWDPETGRQKSQLRRLETCRDHNPRNVKPQIPAESARMRVVLETRGLRRLPGGGCSPAKPVSKSITGNFLKIWMENRLSSRPSHVIVPNSIMIPVGYQVVQALSCYCAEQAFEAQHQAMRWAGTSHPKRKIRFGLPWTGGPESHIQLTNSAHLPGHSIVSGWSPRETGSCRSFGCCS